MLVFKDIRGNRVDPLSHTLEKWKHLLNRYSHRFRFQTEKKTIHCTVIAIDLVIVVFIISGVKVPSNW